MKIIRINSPKPILIRITYKTHKIDIRIHTKFHYYLKISLAVLVEHYKWEKILKRSLGIDLKNLHSSLKKLKKTESISNNISLPNSEISPLISIPSIDHKTDKILNSLISSLLREKIYTKEEINLADITSNPSFLQIVERVENLLENSEDIFFYDESIQIFIKRCSKGSIIEELEILINQKIATHLTYILILIALAIACEMLTRKKMKYIEKVCEILLIKFISSDN